MEDNFECYAKQNEAKGDKHYARELRDAGRIVRHLVRSALKRDWMVSVFDSEEWTVKRSTNFDDIMAAMFTTDDDVLVFRTADGVDTMGRVWLVYGNAGYEVISDYSATVGMEELMKTDIDPYVEKIEAGRD